MANNKTGNFIKIFLNFSELMVTAPVISNVIAYVIQALSP